MFYRKGVIEEELMPEHPHVNQEINIFSSRHVRVEWNAGKNLSVYDHISTEDKGSFLQSRAAADYLFKGLIHSVELVPILHPLGFFPLNKPIAIGLQIVSGHGTDKLIVELSPDELACLAYEGGILESFIVVDKNGNI